MRTVVGSTGYLAADLLFRAERGGKAVAQWPQDRRSAERQYPDSRLSVGPTGPSARYPRRQASTSHPFAHAAHDVVFDLDDLESSKRGGPISRRSRQTMNHSEHARTGTSAVGGSSQSANPTNVMASASFRRALSPRASIATARDRSHDISDWERIRS